MPTPPRHFRFGLRTLFVLVVIVAVPSAWVGYSLNWIRQRHEFREYPDVVSQGFMTALQVDAPWQLRIMGESGVPLMTAPKGDWDEARRLFPELVVLAEKGAPARMKSP